MQERQRIDVTNMPPSCPMHRPSLFLVGMLIPLLTACQKLQTFTPEEVLQKSMQASTALSSVSYTVHATHTTGNNDHVDIILQSNVHRESQKNDWRMSIEHNGTFIGSVAGIHIAPNDLYLEIPGEQHTWHHIQQSEPENRYTELAILPLPATLLQVIQDRGRTQLDTHTVYRYDVALRDTEAESLLNTLTENPSPLPMFHCTGTLWIDSKSFLLRRSTWDITTQASDEIMKIDVTVKNYNTAPTTQIPTVTEEWSPQALALAEHIFENIPPPLSLLLGIPKLPEEMQ